MKKSRGSPEALFDAYRRSPSDESFALVYARTAPAVLRFALWLVRDPNVAEDVTQTTFLEALRSATDFDAGRDLVAWLFGIAANQAREMRRKAGRSGDRIDLASVSEAEQGVLGAAAEAEDPAAVAERTEIRDIVQKGIEGLPQPYREVVRLHVVAGHEPLVVARLLDRPRATVRTQLARGLEYLRRRLPDGFFTAAFACLRLQRAVERVPISLVGAVRQGRATSPSPARAGTKVRARLTAAIVGASALLAWLVLWSRGAPSAHEVAAASTAHADTEAGIRPNDPGRPPPEETARRVPLPAVAEKGSTTDTAATASAHVVVLDAAGQPVPGVSLRLFARSEPKGYVPRPHFGASFDRCTQDDGTAVFEEVPLGRAFVAIDGGLTGTALEVEGDTRGEIRIRSASRVSGTVRDSDGGGVAGASLWLNAQTSLNLPPLEVGRTGPDGAFEVIIPNHASTSALWATAPGHGASPTFERPGERASAIELVLERDALDVRGTVVDADGRPAAGALLSASDQPHDRAFAPHFARADDHGRFALLGLRARRNLIVARAEGTAPTVCAIEPGEASDDVTLRLERGTVLFGRIDDPAGAARGRRTVTVAPRLPEGGTVRGLGLVEANVDADGSFRVENLAVGPAHVIVVEDCTTALAQRNLVLQPGANEWQVQLTASPKRARSLSFDRRPDAPADPERAASPATEAHTSNAETRGASLVVRLHGDASLLAGARVRALTGATPHDFALDATGTWRAGALPPGAQSICVFGPRIAPFARTIELDADVLTEIALDVDAAPTCRIVLDTDSDAGHAEGSSHFVTVRDAAGTLVVHELVVAGPGAPAQLAVGLLPQSSYSVEVVSASGPTRRGRAELPVGARGEVHVRVGADAR